MARQRVAFTLKDEDHERFRALADRRGLSMGEAARQVVMERLEAEEKAYRAAPSPSSEPLSWEETGRIKDHSEHARAIDNRIRWDQVKSTKRQAEKA